MSNSILIGKPAVIFPHLSVDGRFIRIYELASPFKTKWFRVDSKDGGELAYIRFYPKWRKYVFEPLDQTIYEEVCLREIAEFCESQTKEWRTGRRRVGKE